MRGRKHFAEGVDFVGIEFVDRASVQIAANIDLRPLEALHQAGGHFLALIFGGRPFKGLAQPKQSEAEDHGIDANDDNIGHQKQFGRPPKI